MNIRQKIFGIALLVFLVMGSSIFYATYKILEVSREIDALAGTFIPLSDQLAGVDVQIAVQELHVERFEKHVVEARLVDIQLNQLRADRESHRTDDPGQSTSERIKRLGENRSKLAQLIAAEEVDFVEREHEVDRAIKQAEALIAEAAEQITTLEGRQTLLAIQPLLKAVDLQHSNLHAQQAILLEALRQDNVLALELETLIEHENDELQQAMRDVWEKVTEFTQRSARVAGEHEREALAVSIFLTIAAGLLALLISSLIIRGMLGPLRSLMSATHRVESGDLPDALETRTSDEIGELTRRFNTMVEGLRKSEDIKDKFGLYVDPRVVSGLIGDPDMSLVNGEKKLVTVLFSDLANFTGISERLTPGGLVKLVNHYLTTMSGPITKHKGLIDKYIGDAIMAFWTPPFCDDGKQAEYAVAAALEDARLVDKLQQELPDLMGLRKDVPQIGMRIGLATGEALVGSIGSDTAKNYTVMGDTVNLGSRLEGANKVYGTTILVCERTYQLASQRFEFRKIDSIVVLGKTEPVSIYEPLGTVDEVNNDALTHASLFETALNAFQRGDWSAAKTGFDECMSTRPDDMASRVYLSRLIAIERDGAPVDWNGVWHLNDK